MKAFGNYFGMLIVYRNTQLKSLSEEPVLFPACLLAHHTSSSVSRQATKNLVFYPIEEILRHFGAGKERPAPPFLRMT